MNIPCKRPKVTITAHEKNFAPGATGTYHLVTCRVPYCGFRYDAAVISDAQFQAQLHRAAHRSSVPASWIEKDLEYDVYCVPCGGHCRTFPTRVAAQAWLDEHLATEHRLVVCS